MFWQKKKGMIDVRELQKQGKLIVQRDDISLKSNKEGFVEIGSSKSVSMPSKRIASSLVKESQSSSSQESNPLMGLLDFTSPSSSSSSNSLGSSSSLNSSETAELEKRIDRLNKQIYQLEQRIELLERKAGVGSSSDSSVGLAGW